MTPFTTEPVGTMILVPLGDGVVANVVLRQTQGHQRGGIPGAGVWKMRAAGGP